MDFIVGLGRY
jgi:hypothetical protein